MGILTRYAEFSKVLIILPRRGKKLSKIKPKSLQLNIIKFISCNCLITFMQLKHWALKPTVPPKPRKLQPWLRFIRSHHISLGFLLLPTFLWLRQWTPWFCLIEPIRRPLLRPITHFQREIIWCSGLLRRKIHLRRGNFVAKDTVGLRRLIARRITIGPKRQKLSRQWRLIDGGDSEGTQGFIKINWGFGFSLRIHRDGMIAATSREKGFSFTN